MPVAENAVMVVVGLVLLVMVAVPGFPAIGVHVPTPVPARVAVPVEKQGTFWSAPALGFANTVMVTLSLAVQPLPSVAVSV